MRDFSLLKSDCKPGQLPPGPGAAGPHGLEGAQGPAGASGWTYLTAPLVVPASAGRTTTVSCPSGLKAFGGGVARGGTYADLVRESAPVGAATGWVATVLNEADSVSLTYYVRVICASASRAGRSATCTGPATTPQRSPATVTGQTSSKGEPP